MLELRTVRRNDIVVSNVDLWFKEWEDCFGSDYKLVNPMVDPGCRT
jgi:hypothetical protein